MDVFKNIASVFVKMDDEEPEAAASPSQARPAAPPAPLPAPAAVAPAPAPAPMDPAEGKLYEKLAKALEENNLQGIDFFEFRLALDALAGVIADEPTRYRAAFSTLVAQGAKAETLMQTADHYLQVLDAKESSYGEYLAGQQQERVLRKVAEADAYQKQIQEKSAEIARLTQEIAKLTESEIAARNAATLAKAELEASRNTFQAIKGRMAGEIAAVRAKLAQYVTKA